MSEFPQTITVDQAQMQTLFDQINTLTAQNQQQQQLLSQLQQQQLQQQQSQQMNQSQQPIQAPIAYKEPKVPNPDKFSGHSKDLKNFIASVDNVINLQPSRFPNEHIKVLFTSTLLSGQALT
jgi:hypothetical protein